MLTGEGSDEILGGYAHFRADMLRFDNAGQGPAAIARMVEDLKSRNRVSSGILLTDDETTVSPLMQRLLGFEPGMFAPVGARMKRMRRFFRREATTAPDGFDPASDFLDGIDVRRRLAGRAPVHQSLYLWGKSVLPDYILTLLGDRMEMAHSIEGRVPFLDHEVGEFLCNTPVHLKIRGLTEKYILREATRDVLTDTVYRRQKHPFLSPPDKPGEHSGMSELVRDTLTSSTVADVPFLDARAVHNFADELDKMSPQQRGAIDSDVMILVSAVVMHDRFGVSS